jgi:beta-N-acetylhexosaminidase
VHDLDPQTKTPLPSFTRRQLLAAASLTAGSAWLGPMPVSANAEEDLVSDVLRSLSIEKRVAQMFIFHAQGVQMSSPFNDMLRQVKPGGLIFVANNIGSTSQIREFVNAIHRSNPKLTPLVAIDQEGGDVIRLPNDPSPGAMVLGLLPDAEVRARAKDRGKFLARYGFDVNFAPVADVAFAKSSTMYLRSFGNDPLAVAKKVAAVVHGSRAVGIMGAAKHFPGHGRTSTDSHRSIPTVKISKRDWKKSDALPFISAIENRVEMIMAGHLQYSEWDKAPASLSKVAVNVLRHDLGFNGVIVTDDLSMGALGGMDPIQVLDRAVDAGMDMLLYTLTALPPLKLVEHVANRVHSDDVARKRIDASVRRILRAKIRHFGLTAKDFQ